MASITVAATTASATEQAQLYSQDLFHEPHVNSFWRNLQGPGPDYVIQIDDSLKKEQGDRVNFTLFAELTGKGRVVGTANTQLSTLEGNEESPNRYQFGVTLDEIHHNVRTGGKLTEQRLAYKVRPEMKQVLAYWYNRAYDEMIFKKLTGTDYTDDASRTFGDAAVANTNVVRPGGKNSKADIEITDTFVVDLIERAKSMATVGIFGATTAWRIRPFMVGGRPYYGMVIHPYQKYGMRKDPDWKDAVLHARERSQENPIFTGATAIWDNVIIYEHDLVVTGSDAGAGGNVPYANALFFGLQAGVLARAQNGLDWVEKWFQYGTEWGVDVGTIMGFQKTRFNSLDFAVVMCQTAAQNPGLIQSN